MARCNKVGHSSSAPFQWLWGVVVGGVRVGCLGMESRAHPAALALIDLEIFFFFFFATEGAFLSPFPAASFVAAAVMAWDYEEDEWSLFCSSGESEDFSETLWGSGDGSQCHTATGYKSDWTFNLTMFYCYLLKNSKIPNTLICRGSMVSFRFNQHTWISDRCVS